MKHLILLLASVCVVSLIVVTWALTRLSAWIVYHDSVWEKMDAEGARCEHGIAEVFLIAGGLHLPAVEAVVGGVFLLMLWRALSRPPGASSSSKGMEALR